MKLLGQFFTYAMIGAVGTVAHYAVLLMLVELAGIQPVIATSAGFIIGALVNYVLNYKYTFRSASNHIETLTKFFVVAAFGGIVNSTIMAAGVWVTDVNYIIVQLFATGVVLLMNFFINKHWTFACSGTEL